MSDQKKPYLPFAFGRMPGWAISLSVALVATCIAILAMANVYAQARQHRAAVYRACQAQVKSSTQVIDVFGKLRDADQTTLDIIAVTVSARPLTPAARAYLGALQKSVDAYDELLDLAAKTQKVDCTTLK